MEIFSVKNEFKDLIDDIWDDSAFASLPILSNGYAVQNQIIKNSILFVGINPSFDQNSKDYSRYFYDNEQYGEAHKYFKKFQDISKRTNITWTHLDLLYIKKTNQNEVKNIFSCEIGKKFFKRQLELSIKIIELATPRIIVVSNCYARDLLNDYFIFKFDEKIGTNRIQNNEFLNNTPVFFTSMLTGQRALDVGSYERLIWHINKVLQRE